MNPKVIELALRKQRLQMQAQSQRLDMVEHLHGIESVLGVIDRIRDGARWTRENIPILSAGALALLVLKPRLVLRLARRVWLGYLLYRNVGRRINPLLRLLARVRR